MWAVKRTLGQRLGAKRGAYRDGPPNPFASIEANNSRYIKLQGLSRTALPADLRRLCVKAHVEGITSVAINYKRFTPNREGYITLNDPSDAHRALKALRDSVVGGFRVSAVSARSINDSTPARSRGTRGRAEAQERGIVTGDGPNASILERGRTVLVSGLPGKMTAESLRSYFKTFKFSSEEGTKSIVKLAIPEGKMSLTSKHFVRMASQAEAHRLVRRFHMSFFQQAVWGTKYLMKAHVIY